MTFSDIFKNSFLQEFSGNMSTTAVVFYMFLAACFGFYIFLVYRIMTRKNFYQKSFNISLWVLTVIIAAIIITISSNIVLSLGMVGALSIVRYRTAIKDPMDLVFLFWSIAEGIMCGAGMALLAALLALLITVGVFVLDKLPMVRALKIMTISASDYECEEKIMQILKSYCKICNVKSRALSCGGLNLVVEFSGEEEAACTRELMQVAGVHSVTALTHDGEVTF